MIFCGEDFLCLNKKVFMLTSEISQLKIFRFVALRVYNTQWISMIDTCSLKLMLNTGQLMLKWQYSFVITSAWKNKTGEFGKNLLIILLNQYVKFLTTEDKN